MKKLIALAVTALVCGAFFPAYAFEIPPQTILASGESRKYITIRAEKGDSPCSIAEGLNGPAFVGPGENTMDVCVAFVAWNHITRYNKQGNPIILPSHIYKVPTKAGRDALNASIVELMSPARLTGKDIGDSQKENRTLSIDVSTRKALFLAVVFLILIASVTFGYVAYRALSAALTVLSLRDMQNNIAELRKEAAGEKPQVQADIKVPPLPNTRYVLGAEKVYHEPLPAGVAPPPYPGGLTLEEQILNMLRPHPMEKVVAILETIAVHVRRGIKLCNLPEWLRKHPEYAKTMLQNVITLLEMQERMIKAGETAQIAPTPEENLADSLARQVAKEPLLAEVHDGEPEIQPMPVS